MADRGKTRDCAKFFKSIPENFKDIAYKCDVDDASLRKFRDGNVVIRRSTYNKIVSGLKTNYSIMVPDSHFIET